MKKISVMLVLVLVLSLVSFVYAQEEAPWPTVNVCCEKTEIGAWCQNSKEENCVDGFRKTPTSCDGTSFCKLGCCVDSSEGLCMKNTPQKVCEISSGSWIDDKECNVEQCNLGCCVLGDQASFVTLTRCKRISRVYGLETNFKRDIVNEAECILVAHASDKGACVFESEGERTCRFTTRQECSSSGSEGSAAGEFWKDYLCSNDELATSCGPSRETVCLEGKDEVYFMDTCGNPANIYDANRIYEKDASYWQKIVPKSLSCGAGDGNVDSKSCGNCEYLQGSICGKGKAEYGDLNCKDLNCYDTQNGVDYKNGESWCEFAGVDSGDGLDSVGSRYFRHICIHGEEVIEPCADFRNEVCIEESMGSEYGNFNEAACRVNRWTDCIDQFTEKDCLNEDKRDCFWVKGAHYDGSGSRKEVKDLADSEEKKENVGILSGGHICLPKNPVGLEFWASGNSKEVCSLGNSKQVVKFEANLADLAKKTKKCKENCEVLDTDWVDSMNRVCISLGDCGAHVNFVGEYTDDGIIWKQNGRRKNIQTGLLEGIEEEANGGSDDDSDSGSDESKDDGVNVPQLQNPGGGFGTEVNEDENSGDTTVVVD